jgi:hypothetical protein
MKPNYLWSRERRPLSAGIPLAADHKGARSRYASTARRLAPFSVRLASIGLVLLSIRGSVSMHSKRDKAMAEADEDNRIGWLFAP